MHEVARNRWAAGCLAAVAGALLLPAPVRAQTDEIQVYDAQIAPRGDATLTWHDNFTPHGHTQPEFSGGVSADRSLNGVTEWAYGVRDWFEAGLYLPLYTVTHAGAVRVDGGKLRALFVVPSAARRRFFYGINFEFSVNAPHWDPNRYTSEIRPIVGWHLGALDLIVNPILDNSWKGFNQLDFAPATRVAWNISRSWTVATEEYADFGPLRRIRHGSQQSHQLYGVVDYRAAACSVEFGLGFGLTAAADARVVKLMLEFDLR
ncbi:MAG: hypothetical protein JSR67_03460 [Proteobacteria bacterium]|nr:hypothetical protein [Pseudomonadota bacterium]